jgi:phage tail sheath protein FI
MEDRMPTVLSYPGVYIEEVPSGVRTITGVPTSITAFIGRAIRGPENEAITINGFGDFERIYGGLWLGSKLGFAVRDFFLNGGGQAIIVRLFHGTVPKVAEHLSGDGANKAITAAREVAQAAAGGADPAGVVSAAQTKASTFAAEPQKSAAKMVVDAATTAAAAAGATKQTVIAAAWAVVNAPLARARLSAGGLDLDASSPGSWGAKLRVRVDLNGISSDVAAALGVPQSALFNLSVRDARPGGASERFVNLTVVESARRIDRVLAESALVRWHGDYDVAAAVAARAAATGNGPWFDPVWQAEADVASAEAAWTQAKAAGDPTEPAKKQALDHALDVLAQARQAAETAVSDGDQLKAIDFLPADGLNKKLGLYALEGADLFNLLCIPPYATEATDFDVDPIVVSAVTAYCERRRAIHLIDPPPDWSSKDAALSKIKSFPETRSKNAALYFPRLKQPNLLRENRIETFVPCGAVAGVIARTDTVRGVWKAPGGLEATLSGVPQLAVALTDDENGELNPLGINCLRAFPVGGRVVWGARTLRGADQLADEWKYLPVRRTALYIEESLYRGTQWVVFEPNYEPLWAQIRLNVGAFMHRLFVQGAFQGTSPRDAYFVKCDKETTTQADIDLGVVNIAVGFAPLKPAEFVVIRLQQIAGQLET